MTEVPTKDGAVETRPLFVTSVGESCIVFFVVWAIVTIITGKTAPLMILTFHLLEFCPRLVAHCFAGCIVAIPMTVGSVGIALIVNLFVLNKFPVDWLRPGNPRFAGAIVWLAAEVLLVLAISLLSSFDGPPYRF